MAGRICSTAVTPTPRPLSSPLSRRSFVIGAGAVGALLATGCGTTSGSGTAASTTAAGGAEALNLALRFDPNSYALAGIPQRLVASILNNRGEPPTDMPDSVDFQLTRDGSPVGGAITTSAHQD